MLGISLTTYMSPGPRDHQSGGTDYFERSSSVAPSFRSLLPQQSSTMSTEHLLGDVSAILEGLIGIDNQHRQE